VEHLAGTIVAILWVAWLAYWMLSSRDAKETVRSETRRSRTSYVVPLVAAGFLLSVRRIPFSNVSVRWYTPHLPALATQVACVAAGLGFAVWARQHLGRNWSGTVTIKDDHRLVRTGPYRFVRHPIYTGILVAFLGMAVGAGTWTSALACALAVVAFVRKSRLEEQFMIDQFGAQYEEYRSEVPALVPRLAG